jgi:hypothetical protein
MDDEKQTIRFFVKYLCEKQTEKRADPSPVLEFITSMCARNRVGTGLSYPQVGLLNFVYECFLDEEKIKILPSPMKTLPTSEVCSKSHIKISVPPSFPAIGRFCFFCPADPSSENNRRPSSSAFPVLSSFVITYSRHCTVHCLPDLIVLILCRWYSTLMAR